MDIEQARFNMLEQQIRPWNVLDTSVLDLIGAVKRELFVPPSYRALAFSDTEIPLLIDGQPTGEVMLAPKVEARMVQDLAVRKTDSILEIGTGSGYVAALLGRLGHKVVSMEILPGLAEQAKENLRRVGAGNVEVINRDGSDLQAAVGDRRFDVIILSGSVPFLPPGWLERLNDGGRLAAIVGELPVMLAEVHVNGAAGTPEAGSISRRILFDTVAKPLVGFPRRTQFSF